MSARSARAALSLAALLFAARAEASFDDFGLGDGHDGALVVDEGTRAVNGYAALASGVTAGATELAVTDATPFAAGRLVLVWQTGVGGASASGAGGALELDASIAGRWELARVSSVRDRSLVLASPMVGAFEARGAQVVSVPEFSAARVAAGARIVPGRAWDGRVGGVVAMLVAGEVALDGAIAADAMGFRGGVFVNEPDYNHSGCVALDSLAPGTSGAKGEGLQLDAYGAAFNARGNVANGGGGGNCKNAGGAGGGHGGAGGAGGRSYMDGARLVGGMPGQSLRYSLLDRALFGGGGGAGHGNDRASSDGGVGGGWVFLRGDSLTGTGTLSADGAAPRVPNSYGVEVGHDGQGGGGAGGALTLRFATSATCRRVSARGGDGRSTITNVHGPGGGGSGGRVLLQATSVQGCVRELWSGVAGAQTNPMMADIHYGASPSRRDAVENMGVEEAPPGGGWSRSISAPTLDSPADRARLAAGPIAIAGGASAGRAVVLVLDGRSRATTTADGDGRFAITLPIEPGEHTLEARQLEQGAASPPSNRVTIDVLALNDAGPEASTDGGVEPIGAAQCACRSAGMAKTSRPAVTIALWIVLVAASRSDARRGRRRVQSTR